jgi:hypothetical protein
MQVIDGADEDEWISSERELVDILYEPRKFVMLPMYLRTERSLIFLRVMNSIEEGVSTLDLVFDED